MLAYEPRGNVCLFGGREQSGVLDPQKRSCFLEREHLQGLFLQRGPTDDEATVVRQVLTDRILDKSAFALASAVGDLVKSLRLIRRQADVQGNVVVGHSRDDIK